MQLAVRTLPKAVVARAPISAKVLMSMPMTTFTTPFQPSTVQMRCVATKKAANFKQQFEDISYSDEFDESDSIETGKEHDNNTPTTTRKKKTQEMPSIHPLFKMLYENHFHDIDNFVSRSPMFKRDDFFYPMFGRGTSSVRRYPFFPPMPNFMIGDDPWNMLVDPQMKKQVKALNDFRSAHNIRETDTDYTINIDVPNGLSSGDLKVEIDDDSKNLFVTGERNIEEEGMRSSTKFKQQLSLMPQVDVKSLKVNLDDDGTLSIQATKVPEAVEEEVAAKASLRRSIPITKKYNLPTDQEIVQTQMSDAFDESDWVETGKKLE